LTKRVYQNDGSAGVYGWERRTSSQQLEQQSKSFAIAAVAYADALIAELNKPSLSSEVEPEVPALEESAEPLPESSDYRVDRLFAPEEL